MRYVYGRYRTRERAEAALEGFWADGMVGELEYPKVEKIGGAWCVTLWGV